MGVVGRTQIQSLGILQTSPRTPSVMPKLKVMIPQATLKRGMIPLVSSSGRGVGEGQIISQQDLDQLGSIIIQRALWIFRMAPTPNQRLLSTQPHLSHLQKAPSKHLAPHSPRWNRQLGNGPQTPPSFRIRLQRTPLRLNLSTFLPVRTYPAQ
jgi:hypothetical protein